MLLVEGGRDIQLRVAGHRHTNHVNRSCSFQSSDPRLNACESVVSTVMNCLIFTVQFEMKLELSTPEAQRCS